MLSKIKKSLKKKQKQRTKKKYICQFQVIFLSNRNKERQDN